MEIPVRISRQDSTDHNVSITAHHLVFIYTTIIINLAVLVNYVNEPDKKNQPITQLKYPKLIIIADTDFISLFRHVTMSLIKSNVSEMTEKNLYVRVLPISLVLVHTSTSP